MSFILDALKKSEAERQQQAGNAYASVPTGGDAARQPAWVWLLLILLLVNLVVVAGLLLRPKPEPPSAPASVAPRPAAVSAEPLATAPATFEDRVRSAVADKPVRRTSTAQPSEPQSRATTQPRATVSQPPAATPAASGAEVLPSADELRASGELAVGALRLDIHVYAEKPQDRFVFINMVKHREGSTTDDGVTVTEITPDGVILDWRGREFVLSRN